MGGKPPRDRAFARSGRTVDGDDHPQRFPGRIARDRLLESRGAAVERPPRGDAKERWRPRSVPVKVKRNMTASRESTAAKGGRDEPDG